MSLKIITADERLSRKPKINACIFGPPGVGKTYQVRTLDPQRTLVLDMEAGLLAAGDWPGDSIDVRKQAHELGVHPWELCRALACLLGCGWTAVPYRLGSMLFQAPDLRGYFLSARRPNPLKLH